MATEFEYYPLYWSTKKPVPAEKTVTKNNYPVRDGAGTHGRKIGSLGSGTHIVVDQLEDDEGYIRIISVKGVITPPVPEGWVEEQDYKPPHDREWWIDKTALTDSSGGTPETRKYLITDDGINPPTVVKV